MKRKLAMAKKKLVTKKKTFKKKNQTEETKEKIRIPLVVHRSMETVIS